MGLWHLYNYGEADFIKMICVYLSLFLYTKLGSGALSGKMMIERIIENNKIDAYLREG